VLFRDDPPTELTRTGLALTPTWATATLTATLVDQFGQPIPASQFTISNVGDLLSGNSVVLPVTEDPLFALTHGSLSVGYALRIFPGMGGNTQGSVLFRDDLPMGLTRAGLMATPTWIEDSGPLTLVNTPGVPVAGSMVDLPYPFGSNNNVVHNGDFVALPITDNSIYSSISGPYANGYPLNVYPGDLPGNNDTLEFEFLLGGGISPATFVIGGRTYSLVFLSNRPPVADAGPNRVVLSSTVSSTVLAGSATDPDGDAMTYRWLEGNRVLFGPATVVSGAATLNLASVSLLSIGEHQFVLEVSDGRSSSSASMTLTIDNSPPAASATGSGSYQEGVDSVLLDAQVADFDGDALVWQWVEGNRILASGVAYTGAGGAPLSLPTTTLTTGSSSNSLAFGSHQLTLTVSDGINPLIMQQVTVVVVDTLPPRLAPTSSSNILWPPNHNMVPVTILANASDAAGGPVLLSVQVASSEDPDKDGDGHTIPDYTTPIIDQQTGTIAVQLRSERSGHGVGRTYSITIRATDAASNASTATIQIVAPHNH
jgi:hypothetical protein